MGLCKFCNKWIPKSTGKRKKEFCNNTCRSNYWYDKNKKGGKKQKQESPELANEIKLMPSVFDAPEYIPKNDEPKQWVEVAILRTPEKWHELKRACISAEEWAIIKEQILAANNMSQKEKQLIINTP